jgi:hypothetical protein
MTRMLTPEARRWLWGIASVAVAALLIGGVTWCFRYVGGGIGRIDERMGGVDTRLTRIESALEVSPTADSLQRITALETRVDAFEGGGARWSRNDALAQAAEIRRELAELEHDLRGEIAQLRERELGRLRDRVDRLHNHVGGG